MANRYVRATGGNWNAAGTWESSPGAADVVAVPTAADDVFLVVGSGQLTINAAAACRSFNATGYANTITHNAFNLTIGTSTAPPDMKALVLAGTYTAAGATSSITFASTAAGVHTVDYAGKTMGNQIFSSTGSYKLLSNLTSITALAYISFINGTLDFNGITWTNGYFGSAGTNTRTLILGSSVFNTNATGATGYFNISGSNYTISANTATINFSGASPLIALGGANWNGLNFVIGGAAGTVTITGGGTIGNFYVQPTGAKTVTITSGTTITCTGNVLVEPVTIDAMVILNAVTAGNQATISKSSGTVYLNNITVQDIIISGGCSVSAQNSYNAGNNTITTTWNPSILYVDIYNGNDTTNVQPFGWWKVAYTGATGNPPAVDATITGGTSNATAKLCFISLGEWNVLGAGTMYFYGKSGTFEAETISWADGSATISTDLSYSGLKTAGVSGPTAARIKPSDTIRVSKTLAPVSLGNATWTYKSNTVTFATPIPGIKLIDGCESGWAGATIGYYAGRLGNYARVTIPSRVLGSLCCYKNLASTTDFSAYQKLSFWGYNNYDVLTDQYRICLCADLNGVNVVDTFIIPYSEEDIWHVFGIFREGGGNLGSAIKSVALYIGTVASSNGYFYMDDLLACQTNGVSLTSLISKESEEQGDGTEAWYGLNYIATDFLSVGLCEQPNYPTARGYPGATGTVETFFRNPYPSCQITAVQTTKSGTATNKISYLGGFNPTDNTQDGETYYDGANGVAAGIVSTAGLYNYCIFDRFNGTRMGYGYYLASTHDHLIKNITSITSITNHALQLAISYNITFENIGCLHFNEYGIVGSDGTGIGYNNIFQYIYSCSSNMLDGVHHNSVVNYVYDEIVKLVNNGDQGINLHHSHNCRFKKIHLIEHNASYGIYFSEHCDGNRFDEITELKNNTTYGLGTAPDIVAHNNYISNCVISGHSTAGIYHCWGTLFLNNVTIQEATEVLLSNVNKCYENNQEKGVFSTNHDGAEGSHWRWVVGGTINSQTVTRHVEEGLAWKVTTTASFRIANNPIRIPIAQFLVEADLEVTFKCWVKKDHATNIGAGIFCFVGSLTGITSDKTDTKADDTDWEELSISFTPTQAGVVEIFGQVWYVAGNSSAYFHDITITQA